MQKLVYLFELDSVRKSDNEILIGQQALYNEIVGNGNTVVLTYNQLVDQRGFFSLLDIDEYYNNLVKLFKSGAIRVSQFGDIRTISQYLINACSSERSFIYSGWPLKSTQKRLLALIKRCLMYSDLNEINDYKEGIRSDAELLDLFIEVDSNLQPHDTTLNVSQCKDIIENLFHLIKTVLRLSSIHTIYISPKPDDEYAMSLPKYLQRAMKLTAPDNGELWDNAVSMLNSLDLVKNEGSNDRSDYHHAIRLLYKNETDNGNTADIQVYQYAEAIVDLCYNYQLEYSICNSSKHYNIKEFKSDNPADWITFSADFFSRLRQTWNTESPGSCYLLEESNVFDEYQPPTDFPDFSKAVHMVGYTKADDTQTNSDVQRYEFQLSEQKVKRRRSLLVSIRKKILLSLLCFSIALAFEVAFECLQNLMDAGLNKVSWININPVVWTLLCTALEVLVILGITENLTTRISKRFPGFLSLSESLQEMHSLVGDEHSVIRMFKRGYNTYSSSNTTCIDDTEPLKEGKRIDFVTTSSLKQYLRLHKQQPGLFRNTDISLYPLAEIPPENDKKEQNALIKCWLRLEELFGYDFGVVYKSKYNSMVVDPIKQTCPASDTCQLKPFFPYERVIPTSGKDGVVMIPKHEGKYILIKQFRHAIRAEQYCFPRGYAENGGNPEDNAVRELQEELNAHNIGRTELLGRVAPDSGLSSTQAYVFAVELDDYSAQIGHEGILEVVELTTAELDAWIKAGKITDGFTLSAWILYKDKNED